MLRSSSTFLSFLLVAAAASSANGAVLVRFINTVPTRTEQHSFDQFTSGAPPTAAARAPPTGSDSLRVLGEAALSSAAGLTTNRVSLRQDRVGLQYFYDNTNTRYVQTQTLEFVDANGAAAIGAAYADIYVSTTTANNVGVAPYPWYQALPALRGYHQLFPNNAAASVQSLARADRPFGSTENTQGAFGHLLDYYESSQLRADGVLGYLSFAPGTYTFQAYSVMSDTAPGVVYDAATKVTLPSNLAAAAFTGSKSTFSFSDNKVYTIIAIGDGQYANGRVGNTVKLVLLEESIAPTTFGSSSLRFVHAVGPLSAQRLDVYLGAANSGRQIAAGISFGSVSDYVSVNPTTAAAPQQFQLAYTANGATTVAAQGPAVTREVRAGSRVTVVCAVNSVDQPTNVFCRGFPSRVVAYVRLALDTQSGFDRSPFGSYVQGAAGGQKITDTKLSLFASYEYPRPEVLVEQSQVASMSVATMAAPSLEGLYPVVINVPAGNVSGYGEVHVPVHIMDFAVRPVIMQSVPAAGNPAAVTADFIASGANAYWFAPVWKRVHFVVKTDGFATVAGRYGPHRNALPLAAVTSIRAGFATDITKDPEVASIHHSLSIDKYVEPGQYYTFGVSGNYLLHDDFATDIPTTLRSVHLRAAVEDGAGTRVAPTLPITSYQESAVLGFSFNLDRNIDAVANAAGGSAQGTVVLYPLAAPAIAGVNRRNGADNAGSAGVLNLAQSFGATQVIAIDNGNPGRYGAFASGGASTISLQLKGTTSPTTAAIPLSASGAVTANAAMSAANPRGLAVTPLTTASAILLAPTVNPISNNENANIPAGTYTLSFALTATPLVYTPLVAAADAAKLVNADNFAKCFNSLPATSEITVTAGQVLDVFVFGTTECYTPPRASDVLLSTAQTYYLLQGSSDQTRLRVVTATRASAVATGHSPFPTTFKRAETTNVDVPLYSAASSLSFSIFAVLALIALSFVGMMF